MSMQAFIISPVMEPFAINLPILNFSIPTEGVKIYDTYPDFIEWVKSKGTSNTNWYKNKK